MLNTWPSTKVRVRFLYFPPSFTNQYTRVYMITLPSYFNVLIYAGISILAWTAIRKNSLTNSLKISYYSLGISSTIQAVTTAFFIGGFFEPVLYHQLIGPNRFILLTSLFTTIYILRAYRNLVLKDQLICL